ncbi:oleate hydratase [Rhodoferax sp.]|uniref:oleate hydratase n=1 Tax=Rhodoferax sp. TaxID=50421 RepID=UPI0027209A4F|nr:oleate hydratase [Rhodoferax sp.]MDO9198115.1 oleate hydratase [Rhodoferax sp.]
MSGSTNTAAKEASATNARHGIQAYLVGGGIASLAAAAYLIRDGHVPGHNIHILEEAQLGGSLDAGGSAAQGYSMRGSRMFGPAYVLTYDLLAGIPSLDDPNKSVTEDTFEFWLSDPWFDRARLVENGKVVDVSSWGFANKDRVDLIELMLRAEGVLGARRIDECFEPHFFETNFWRMWSSMFGFETWHSAVELRRYLLRFLRLFPDLETLQIIQSTRYCGYDSIIRPLLRWLEGCGVQFDTGVQVTDLHFVPANGSKAVRRIACVRDGRPDDIEVGERDLVIATLGSMTADSSLGSMSSAPVLKSERAGGAWALWERLAAKDPAFGRPSVFCGQVDQTKWVTFTVTDSDELFVKLMARFSASPPGCGGLVTLKGSSWGLTFHLYHPPAYADQPEGVFVCWGYGLFPDRAGDFVNKRMSECNGREILVEVFSHLGFQGDMAALLATSNCIPCLLPYTTSQFMPRARGDRPEVVPAGTVNLAFIGQYCEIPDDVVYTVEYSVHSARLAVASLLGFAHDIPETYKGLAHPNALVEAMKMILR